MDWCHDLSVQRQRPNDPDERRKFYLYVGDSHDHYGHGERRDPLSVLGLLTWEKSELANIPRRRKSARLGNRSNAMIARATGAQSASPSRLTRMQSKRRRG